MKTPKSDHYRWLRHIRLSTKIAPKNYYKGTRTGSVGRHTRFGGYWIDYNKVRRFMVPEGLADLKLKPFVTKKIIPIPGDYGPAEEKERKPIHGAFYLRKWKEENGED